jgi:hypothetical protein
VTAAGRCGPHLLWRPLPGTLIDRRGAALAAPILLAVGLNAAAADHVISPSPAVACGREYGGQLQPPTRTRESNFLVFHVDVDHISARRSKYHGPFLHIESFLLNETWYHFHARKIRPPLTSVAGPRHPANALAVNH